jgi:ribosome-associated protein
LKRTATPRRPKNKRPKSPQELAAFAVGVLDDLKAQDIEVLDVRHLTSIMDVMIVASGRSDRHVRALADTLIERCREIGIPLLGVEGQEGGEWVLVDLADVVVHVMLPRTRAFYEIEKLWDISSLGAEAAEQ